MSSVNAQDDVFHESAKIRSKLDVEDLDLPRARTWRRYLPSWFQSLFWVDSAAKYDAFLSYSWKSDFEVAPVVQSVLQRFLCPWYRLRSKTVFRDLTCLPAGSSLETEICARLDRAEHLIVFACPEATISRGMEMEADHWLQGQHDGQVLILVTGGEIASWEKMRQTLLPPSFRDHMQEEPLWVSLLDLRKQIISDPKDPELREKLVEQLKQIFLRLYPGHDWGQLRGEERRQRRRALGLISSVAIAMVVLFAAALIFGLYALSQQHTAQSLQLAAEAEQVAYDPVRAVGLAIASNRIKQTDDSFLALSESLESPQVHYILHHNGPVRGVAVSSDGLKIATASDDGFTRIWDSHKGTLLQVLASGIGSLLAFSPDATRIVAGARPTLEVWNVNDGKPIFSAIAGQNSAAQPQYDDTSLSGVAYSSDGTRILTTTQDGNATLWNAATGKEVVTFEVCSDFDAHGKFSADSKFVVTFGGGCVVAEVREAKSGKLVSTAGHFDPKEAENYQGHGRPRWVTDAVFSPDSQSLAFIMAHDVSEIYDVRTGRVLHKFDQITSELTGAAFSSDGKKIVTPTNDFRLVVWNAQSFQVDATLVGHTNRIFRAEFTNDGKQIISASTDNTVRVWDVGGYESLILPTATLGGDPEAGMLQDFALFGDGSWVVTARADDTARVWDTEVSHPRLRLSQNSESVAEAVFSPDSSLIAGLSKDHTGAIWAFPSGRATAQLCCDTKDGWPDQIFFSPDGKLVFTRDRYAHLLVWDASSGKKLSTLPTSRYEGGVQAFSPDFRRFVIRDENYDTATVWDTVSGNKLCTISGNHVHIIGLEFLPNGSQILSSAQDKTIRVYNAATGHLDTQFSLADIVEQAFLLPGGTRVFTIDDSPKAQVWDLGSQQLILTLNSKLERGAASTFSPDGTRLSIVSHEDSKTNFQLFDLHSGNLIATLDPVTTDYQAHPIFSSDSRRLLTIGNDRIVRIFDAKKGILQLSLSGHTDAVEIAKFSPDGARVCSAGRDGTVRVWNSQSGHLLAVYRVNKPINNMNISSDSRHLIVATAGSGALVYSLDSKDLVESGERLMPIDVRELRH